MSKPTSNPVILDKPEGDQRCYINVKDGRTKKSKGLTIYGVTPDQATELIKQAIEHPTPNPEANAA